MTVLGIDSGSSTTKGVLFDGEQILSHQILPTSTNPGKVLRQLCEQMRRPDTQAVVTTGYGRDLLPEADLKITEITCHGEGAAFFQPGCNTVIDIGGQDSKVILLNPSGKATDFLMNDKCAAGTGRFIEMTMDRVGSSVSDLDCFVAGSSPVQINSMCAVFAESEIVGLLTQEILPGDIVLGCIHSICRRTAVFAQKIAPGNPMVFFSGGLAKSRIIRTTLGVYLKAERIESHPLCQYTGAAGAAVIGYRKLKSGC